MLPTSNLSHHDIQELSECQERDILLVFKSKGYCQWIELTEFPHLHEFNRAIHNLRHKQDLNIQNRCERARKSNGRALTKSFYRLNPGSWAELRGKPESEKRDRSIFPSRPVTSWEETCRERERKLSESQAAPDLVLTP